jgi:hypothetical protein
LGPSEKISISPGQKVLIADDMQLNQFLMGELLKDCGFVPIYAGNGQQALQLASDELFAIIFLDVYMPVMDGLQCAQQIRGLSNSNATVPIVAITANQFESDESVFKKAGINATLVKPITKEQIENLIWQLAERDPVINLDGPATDSISNKQFDIDLTYLKRSSKEDPVFLVKMLDSFCTTTEQLLIELEKAISQKDALVIKNLIHQLKFPMSVVGQNELVNQLNEFEKSCDGQGAKGLVTLDYSSIERLLPVIRNLVTQARIHLAKMTL